jgi:rhamnopyranosyl-N-acetylglucosaminyl-diphospho-decaprenol beta-1,3/1,4-galactofuranosyltransferase
VNPSVSAVVATYNRCALLRECLDALLCQTRPVDRVIVVDNACDDGTAEILTRDYPSIDVVHLDTNAGSSGGVCAGMQRAVELGCDWVWVMDDDAEPAPDALEQLCKHADGSDLAALACLKIGPDGQTLYGHRGTFTPEALPRRIIRPICKSDIAAGQPIEVDHVSFVGLMVSKHAVDSAGYPDPRLFLQFDDVEYCIRLRQAGRILLVPASRIVHKEQDLSGLRHRRLLSLPYESIPYEHFWKRYFTYRNFVWMSRRFGTRRVRVYTGLVALYGFLVCCTLLFETRRLRRISLLTHAFLDGLRGRFDNTKARRVLGLDHPAPARGGRA